MNMVSHYICLTRRKWKRETNIAVLHYNIWYWNLTVQLYKQWICIRALSSFQIFIPFVVSWSKINRTKNPVWRKKNLQRNEIMINISRFAFCVMRFVGQRTTDWTMPTLYHLIFFDHFNDDYYYYLQSSSTFDCTWYECAILCDRIFGQLFFYVFVFDEVGKVICNYVFNTHHASRFLTVSSGLEI